MNRTTNWNGPFRGFLWNLYERLGVMLQGHPSTVREYRLEDKVEANRRYIKMLQARLREVRADNFDYSQLPLQYRDKLADVFCYSREMLRSAVRFDVRENRSRGGWETVTEHCCFCGCDLGVITLPTERDALLYAVSLDVVGYHPPHSSACADCYECT